VDGLLAVAKVGRSHGLRGEFRLWPLTEGSDALSYAESLTFVAADGRRSCFRVLSVRGGGKGLIVSVEGIATREQAEEWKHAVAHMDRAQLPSLPDDEWYEFELAGLPVVDVSGHRLGEVAGLVGHGGQDVLVVMEDGGDSEFQIPFVDGMVEVEEGRVRIDPPEGLLEATRAPYRGNEE
jgi:16S rRNA processing protein RimM